MGNIELLFWFVPFGAVVALIFAMIFYKSMMKAPEGSDKMKEIAKHVRDGAMAYLKQQYKIVSIFFIVACISLIIMAFGFNLTSKIVPFAFLTGGFFSALAGYLGMLTATNASSRTAEGCKNSLNDGLKVSFRSGAVMGMVVVGLGLLDIALWFIGLRYIAPKMGYVFTLKEITLTMLSFGMGASLQALFARVGGGIYTKAADVGADLVGKVEKNIPEDDPRNPATIADNVGDNVGDVAGMGADLYESYVGSILAAAALGVAAFAGKGLELNSVLLPMIIAAVGIILSIFGIFAVKTKENASQKELLNALARGVNLSFITIALASAGAVYLLLPNNFNIFGAIMAGLISGYIVGKATEYYTSEEYKHVKGISDQAKMGPANVIIDGFAVGQFSVGIPVITIVIGILVSYYFAGGTTSAAMGLYGVSMAAVGMLSSLGIQLATDAFGPIADNAGGNAEMSGLDPSVRKRTDALDSLGNTTAATGKGFAINSAALTALALLSSYVEEVRITLERIGVNTMEVAGKTIQTANATLADFMAYYDVTLMNPKVIGGLFLGGMTAFVFSALTMKAVGRSAGAMVEEVRRQFREIKGILEGKATPDYASCVEISTKGAQKEMIMPALIGVLFPIITSVLLGVAGVMGFLAGVLLSGLLLAISMASSGGAWDNAKKYIESGVNGGKGSDAHKAAVVGDTVGDPFKDTSGPSLNILIKLSTMISIVFVGLAVSAHIL